MFEIKKIQPLIFIEIQQIFEPSDDSLPPNCWNIEFQLILAKISAQFAKC